MNVQQLRDFLALLPGYATVYIDPRIDHDKHWNGDLLDITFPSFHPEAQCGNEEAFVVLEGEDKYE